MLTFRFSKRYKQPTLSPVIWRCVAGDFVKDVSRECCGLIVQKVTLIFPVEYVSKGVIEKFGKQIPSDEGG
jgi:hypothetical protein